MVVRGEHAWPSVEHDLFAVLDVVSRFVPPTFYHHRFLQPRRLRKLYLDVIRSFGGRGRLGSAVPARRTLREVRRDEPDVVVVGAGRGGLLAAIGAAEGGARVVVLEADATVGFDAPDLLARAGALAVDVRTGTVATGWYGGLLTAMDASAIWELRPRALVAATGTYELVPSVRGSDRPGVMSARLTISLVREYGLLPGRRALLVGEGAELEAAGAALQAEGSTIVGPIATGALRSIEGRGSVTGARYVDAAGSERRERVDLVVLADRTPSLELPLAAGARLGWQAGRLAPMTAADGQTSVASLFVAGGAAGVYTESSVADAHALHVGRAAGAFALGQIRGGIGRPSGGIPHAGIPGGDPSEGRPTTAAARHAVVCFCEDVRAWEIHAERGAGYTDPELIKRRSGALTGPCQGKFCLAAVTCAASAGDAAAGDATSAAAAAGSPEPDILVPTGRPPLRPIALGDLVADEPS